MPNGVRCPHCGASGLHREGYTDKGAAKYHCLNCHEYLNALTNSVSAFVREVQEIAEKIEEETILKDLIEINEVYITAGEKGIKQDRPRRKGLRRRGGGTYEGDKPPVQTFKRRGKTGFFVKRNPSRADTKKMLKTVSEGEIRVDTDEYLYGGNRGENVKEHRFVNHSEEYAKGNMHVNIHRSVPDGSGG